MNWSLLMTASVMVTACSDRLQTASLTKNHITVSPLSLVQRAEQSLADTTVLDFRRPFVGLAYRPTAAIDLYVAACRAGDRSACRIGISLAGVFVPEELSVLVREYCRAGDQLSCRSIPTPYDGRPRDGLLGELGRSTECSNYESGCDTHALRLECDAGYPLSCRQLVSQEYSSDFETILARVVELGTIGCSAGIASECRLARGVEKVSPERWLAISKQMCKLSRICSALVRIYRDRNDLREAAKLWERSCQYADDPIFFCLTLGVSYMTGELPEPREGRGQALVDWACARIDLIKDERCRYARPTTTGWFE